MHQYKKKKKKKAFKKNYIHFFIVCTKNTWLKIKNFPMLPNKQNLKD